MCETAKFRIAIDNTKTKSHSEEKYVGIISEIRCVQNSFIAWTYVRYNLGLNIFVVFKKCNTTVIHVNLSLK